MWAIGTVETGIVLVGFARIVMGGMNHTAIWLIGIAIKRGYEKSQDLLGGGGGGGRDTVESIPLRRHVMDDMTIVAHLLELLLCALWGARRLVHDGALVLQRPHHIRTDGDEERKSVNQQKQGVVPMDTTILHIRVGVQGVC